MNNSCIQKYFILTTFVCVAVSGVVTAGEAPAGAGGGGSEVCGSVTYDTTDPLALHKAARDGDSAEIVRLICAGFDVNQQNRKFMCTPLHAAIKSGCVEAVRLLLDNRADVHALDIGNYWPPLLYAAALHSGCGGYTHIIRLLLDHGAKINAKALDGLNALYYAALGGDAECVELLLDRGAEINGTTGSRATPLHGACLKGHVAVVQLLLRRGADPDIKDMYGQTALDMARSEGHSAVVDVFMEHCSGVSALAGAGGRE